MINKIKKALGVHMTFRATAKNAEAIQKEIDKGNKKTDVLNFFIEKGVELCKNKKLLK